jgi:hypothetical protein
MRQFDGLSVSAADRDGGDSGNDGTSRDVMGDNCIRANGRAIADGNTAQDGGTTADPNFIAQDDRTCGVAGIPNGHPWGAQVIRVAEAGIFADHRTATDGDARHRHHVNPRTQDGAIPDRDGGVLKCFQIDIRIKQRVFTEANAACAMDVRVAQDDYRRWEGGSEARGEGCVGDEAARKFTGFRCNFEQKPERCNEQRFYGRGRHSIV